MSDLLTYKGFSGSVEFSAEDECLVGEVLFIEGKIAYFGESLPELKSMFHEAVDGYLEMCEERGIEPLKPFKGSFNVRVGPELHKAASLEAKRNNVALNTFVADAIREKLEPKSVHHHTHIHEAEVITQDVLSEFTASFKPQIPNLKIIQRNGDREAVKCH